MCGRTRKFFCYVYICGEKLFSRLSGKVSQLDKKRVLWQKRVSVSAHDFVGCRIRPFLRAAAV